MLQVIFIPNPILISTFFRDFLDSLTTFVEVVKTFRGRLPIKWQTVIYWEMTQKS